MPVITTHHSPILQGLSRVETDKASLDINLLVSSITFDILRDSPGLVAEVANGNIGRNVLETAIIRDIDRNRYHLGLSRQEIINKVFDYMFGYGDLQPYIDDEEITDIDGTKYNQFVIKKGGKRQVIPVSFGNENIFDTYCKLVAIRNGGILNENDSHCRVTDEKKRLRINVSIKPRNVSGASISIRKHRRTSYTLEDLIELEMLNNELGSFLCSLAQSDSSVMFCGKGAAGKTTLMRAFVNLLPEMERVLIVESDAEIYPDKPYCIEQRIKKSNEGGRPVTLKDLVRDGLTMSLDTYCIGEIVGDEAWEFIKSAYTGHKAIATTHSESAEDAFARLLTLSKSANIGESEKTIKEMMARSIDVVVYLENFKVTDVLEVTGYNEDRDSFEYNRLFSFDVRRQYENESIEGVLLKCNEPASRLKEKLGRRGLL